MNLRKGLKLVGMRTWLKLTGVLALMIGLTAFSSVGETALERRLDRTCPPPGPFAECFAESRDVMVWVSWAITSGRPNPCIGISDPAKLGELAKFFKDLPKTDRAKMDFGSFLIHSCDRRIPDAYVFEGVIELAGYYYEDKHGLEGWLKELFMQPDPVQPSVPDTVDAKLERLAVQVTQLGEEVSAAKKEFSERMNNFQTLTFVALVAAGLAVVLALCVR